MGSKIKQTVIVGIIVISGGMPLTVLADEPGSDALVAAYGFDEGAGNTTADASGYSLTGAITGAAWSGTGRFGNALSFDGSGDWVAITNVALLNLTTGLTVQAWVQPAALGNWHTVVLKERPGALSYALYADNATSRPAGYANFGSPTSTAVTGTGSIPLNTWTHLALTYDQSALRLYTNGILAGTQPASSSIVTSSSPLRIGGNSVWGEYFTGLIDEVRVHNRALSQGEIQSLMTVPVNPGQGFEFIIYNNPVSLGLSDSGLFNLGIAPIGGFTGGVFPVLSGLPPDTTGEFEPPNGPPHPGPFALTITTGPTTPAGTYSLTLTATNGSLSASTNLTLIVQTNADFRFGVEPTRLIVAQGQTGTAVYELIPENGYAQQVTLEATGAPAGVAATFLPPAAIPPSSGGVQFAVDGSAAPGTYDLILEATDGVIEHQTTFQLTVQENTGDGSWRQLSLGDSGAWYYGVIVGDVGGVGTNRVYGSAGDGLMYEYLRQGTNWTYELMPVGVPADGQMHNMDLGPGRGDGTNRLYIAAAGSGRVYEMSWVNSSWVSNLVTTLPGATDVIIGDGRNDGVTRMYVTWLSGTTEFTWDGASWTSLTMNDTEGGFVHGVDLGDGRNDGTNRIYTANQGNGEVYEYTWTGSNWFKLFMGDTVDARNIEVGQGRNDGTNRVYVPSGAGNVFEFTWNGAVWQELSMGNGGHTGVKVHAIPAAARSDGLTRIYVAADSGVFEYEWNGSWNAVLLGNATAYMYGLARGDGLNNGRTQIYGSSYDGNVFLFEWVSAAATVPDVVGWSQASAGTAITNAGLVMGLITTIPSESVSWGNIVSQQPAAGTELAPGSAVNLMVSIGPPPALQITPSAGQLLLSWPTSSPGFTLWFTTNLADANWTSVSPAPSVVNGSYVVTNQADEPAGFYQLRTE